MTALYLLFLREKHCIVFYVCTGLAGIPHPLSIAEVKQMDLLFKSLGSETFFF